MRHLRTNHIWQQALNWGQAGEAALGGAVAAVAVGVGFATGVAGLSMAVALAETILGTKTALPDADATIAALLHDAVEDTEYNLDNLSRMGFSKAIIDALALLTHDDSVPNMDNNSKIKGNTLARTVKIADLMHNSDLSRLEDITGKDRDRMLKYQRPLEVLVGDEYKA